MSKFSEDLNNYIKALCSTSNLDKSTVEKVVNSQVAMLLVDLSVKQESETYLGKASISRKGVIKLDPSQTLTELSNGDINPMNLLMEIING